MTAKVVCPVCHGENFNAHFYGDGNYYEVGCENCGALISRVDDYGWRDYDNGGLKDSKSENED